MRLAIIGSRKIEQVDLSLYVPSTVTEIVSGGAKGVDCLAATFARTRGILLTEFLPQYQLYGRAAPLKRNEEIIAYADEVLAFWDGVSAGTAYVIRRCRECNMPCRVITV